MSRVIVVGGGAAGMMCAVSAADCGHQVILLEQNEKLGKKLYITGKGRCNVTNDTDVEGLLQHTVRNPRFLYSAYYSFDSQRMMGFLEQEGLRLKTERGGRVFPVSDHSSDVIRTLERALKRRGVQICLRTKVLGLLEQDGTCCGVLCRGRRIAADAVVAATGGLSYPSTGSTGDGYRFAGDLGHEIIPTFPSLVPLEVEEGSCRRLQGLSLKNVSLKLLDGDKTLYEGQGEMLFTHFGISGPLVLTASCYMPAGPGRRRAVIDMKPALTRKQLDERILRDFAERQNHYFKNSLSKLVPSKMIPVIVELSGISPEKPVHEITRQERERLVAVLKGIEMTVTGPRDFAEAVITRGGVSVRDVTPQTMESKKIPGLYFAGEVLDLDAVTGGYNLQIAWSTGYLAGLSVR